MAREMKDSGIEWIGKIPSHWKLQRLKTVFNERKEKNDPQQTDFILSLGANYGVIPYSEKEGGGNKAKEEVTDYKLAYPNDIVMNSMNIISGSVGISKYFGCVSPVYYMLFPREEGTSPEFYCQMFQTKAFQRSLLGLGNGILMKESSNGSFNTVRMRIPMEKLGIQLLPVPPISEQHLIASFLDHKCAEIDSVVAATQRTIEEYKALKQSIITEAVTKGVRGKRPMKDSGIEPIDEIPEEWRYSPIKYVAKFQPTCNTSNLSEDTEITYTPMDCIKNGYYVQNTAKYGTVTASLTPYEEGDIVMAKVTPCFENGNISIMENLASGFGMGSSELFVYRAIDVNVRFLLYWLQNDKFKDGACATMTGTGGLKRVSPYYAKNAMMLLPSDDEQAEIVAYLDTKCAEMDSLIVAKEKLLTELESYKKSVIYEYVTGKKEAPVCQ